MKAPAPAAPARSAGRASGPVAKGAKVKLVDLSSEDAYYADKAGIVGKSCTATDALTDHGGGWYGGPIACEDGSDYYFYKVGISTGSASASALTSVGGSAGGSTVGQDLGDRVADGTRVTIRDLRTGDLYYDNRGDYIGQACTVKGDLHRNDGLFYGGGLTCGGQYWYFAYVSVSRR